MANQAAIEVYGPFDQVRHALEKLPYAGDVSTNRLGALVIDLGEHALVVHYDDTTESTLIVVDGRDTDARALEVFGQLAAVLPYAMDVTDADLSRVLARRGAVPAA